MFQQYATQKREKDGLPQWRFRPIRHGMRILLGYSFLRRVPVYVFLPLWGLFVGGFLLLLTQEIMQNTYVMVPTFLGMLVVWCGGMLTQKYWGVRQVKWLQYLIIFMMAIFVGSVIVPMKGAVDESRDSLSSGLVGMMGAWSGGIVLGIYWGSKYFPQEVITLTANRMNIRRSWSGMLAGKTYEISRIRNFRVVQGDSQKKPCCFTYDTHMTIYFGKGLSLHDAQSLTESLSAITTFSCHTTEVVGFGTPSVDASISSAMLYNPDVSALSFPFIHLKRIVIDTHSCDGLLVERFLTYAVAVLGQDYLHRTVTAELIGPSEKLHPNIRNNIRHLCNKTIEGG